MFPPFPELKQRDAKPETPLDIRTLNQPIDSRAKIVMLDIAPRQPAGTLGLGEVRVSFLRQHQAIGRMSPPRCLLLTAVAEALHAILANSFEHSKTRFIIALVGLLDQTLVDQGGHHVEDFRSKIVARIAYGFRGFQRAAA